MGPRPVRGDPSLGCPVQEADPEEVRLVDVLDRLHLLGEDRREGGHAHRPAPELADDRGEQPAVRRVEALRVDLEDAHRLVDGGAGHPPVAVDLGVVPDALEEPVHDPRGGPAPGGDGGRGIVRDLEPEDGGRAADDRPEILLRVEVQPVDRPEAVPQRSADPPGPRRGADDRERPEREAQRAGGRALADHDVERAVLHGRVEDLLHGAVEPVDLVDEQDVALVERGQDGRQVACPLDRGPRRVPDVDAQLAGDDRGERRLAEARRAVQEDVVRRLSPLAGSLQEHREAGLDLALAEVLVKRARPQGALDRDLLLVEEVRRQEAVAVRHRPESIMRRACFARMFDPSQEAQPPDRARRAALTRSSSVPPPAAWTPTPRAASRASASV